MHSGHGKAGAASTLLHVSLVVEVSVLVLVMDLGKTLVLNYYVLDRLSTAEPS